MDRDPVAGGSVGRAVIGLHTGVGAGIMRTSRRPWKRTIEDRVRASRPGQSSFRSAWIFGGKRRGFWSEAERQA